MSKSEDMFWAAIRAANVQSAESDNRAMLNLDLPPEEDES